MSKNFIDSSVEAGQVRIGSYDFASAELLPVAKKAAAANETETMVQKGAVALAEEPDGDDELKVHFRLNATGNVWYATTTKADSLNESTRDLFDSVQVLFAAMTKAMAEANKNLFDFDDWSKLIRKSGFFIEAGKIQKTISIKATTVTVDTQVLQQLLPGVQKAPSAMAIGKDILSAINGEYGGRQQKATAKMAHLLFICEEIMGASSVSVRLFYADSKQMELMTKSPCHKSSTTSYEQDQRIDTFRFVSPEQIARYAKKFKDEDQDYLDLVKRLKDALAG